MIVIHPTHYIQAKFLLTCGITHSIAPTRQLFQVATHLGLCLGMYGKLALALVDVKRVTEILHTTDIGDYRLFIVDL